MKRLTYILLLLCATQTLFAQRLIRRSSRHYVEAQMLPERVEPMLTDDWHQYPPYNSMCPLDSVGRQCIIGCVATAMAQLMHYWEWPKQGMGYHEYEDVDGCGQTLSANFAEHVYDWEHMLDTYVDGNYTQQEVDAVSLLGLDCGIAVNMRYGYVTSGAQPVYQPMALVNYFRYDAGAQLYFRDFYSLADLTLMMKKELAAGRPVLASGYNNNMGHAYVIDGYNENEEFHIALGLGGHYGDGWTNIPNMTPWQPEWYDLDSPENGMNILQIFAMGIMPNSHPEATGVERHNYTFQYVAAVTDDTHTSPVYERNNVKLTVHDLSNLGWNLHEDSVAVVLKHDDAIVCPLYVYDHPFLLEEVDDTTYTDTLRLSIPSQVENGVYTIVPMYRDNTADGGKEWREALTCTGTPNYLIARVQDDSVILQSDTASTAYLTLEDIDIPDLFINSQAQEYSITFKNHNTEMAGRFYLLMEPLFEGGTPFYLQRQGLTMAKDEVSTRRFHMTNIYAPHRGAYRLHVFYEANLFADELIELELPEEKIITVIRGSDLQIAQR